MYSIAFTDCLISVSYTHLDVYKRQVMMEVSSGGKTIPMVFMIAQGLPFKAMLGCDTLRRHSAIINMGRGRITPVSYTHLDVYKRQYYKIPLFNTF